MTTPRRGRQLRERAQTYSFPLLSLDELVDNLSDLGIPVELSDLEKPTARSVRPIYESLCEYCMGVTREELNQPQFAGLDALQYPQLHEGSVPQLNFFRALCKLLSASGVADTTLRDVTKPDSKRLRQHLSAVVNFAKFREERLLDYQEAHGRTDELQLRKERADEQVAALRAEVEELRAKHEAERPVADRIDQDCNELMGRIKDSEKRTSHTKHEIAALKERSSALGDKMASLENRKVSAMRELERMRGGLVHSPARLKHDLELQHSQLESAKEENVSIERGNVELRTKLDAVDRAEKDLNKALKLLDATGVEMAKCKTAAKEAKANADSIETHSLAMREHAAQKKHLERQYQLLEEKISRLHNQKAVKCEAAAQALGMAEKERDALLEESNAATIRVSENARTETRLQQQVAELRAAHEEAMGDKRAQFFELQAKVEAYNESLLQQISTNIVPEPTGTGKPKPVPVAPPEAPAGTMPEELAA